MNYYDRISDILIESAAKRMKKFPGGNPERIRLARELRAIRRGEASPGRVRTGSVGHHALRREFSNSRGDVRQGAITSLKKARRSAARASGDKRRLAKAQKAVKKAERAENQANISYKNPTGKA